MAKRSSAPKLRSKPKSHNPKQNVLESEKKKVYSLRVADNKRRRGARSKKTTNKRLEPSQWEWLRTSAVSLSMDLSPNQLRQSEEKESWLLEDRTLERPQFPKLRTQSGITSKEDNDLFKLKCKLCRIKYSWKDPEFQSDSKALKQQTLHELNSLIRQHTKQIDNATYACVMKMICINLFRELPRLKRIPDCPFGLKAPDKINVNQPAWPHLSVVYDILYYLLEAKSLLAKITNRNISKKFVLQLMNNSNSCCELERQSVKVCLHRAYVNFSRYRCDMFERMQHICLWYTHVDDNYNGIVELLNLMYAIISGFRQPLKSHYRKLLQKVLLPMHSCRSLACFFVPLSCCIAQFVKKEPNLAENVLLQIIKNWPKDNQQKEFVMIQELQDILQITPKSVFVLIYEPLVKHLAKCTCNTNVLVSTYALEMWDLDYYVALISLYPKQILEIYVPYILTCSEEHWNTDCRETAESLLDLFHDLHGSLCQKLIESSRKKRQKELEHRRIVDRTFEFYEKHFQTLKTMSKQCIPSTTTEQTRTKRKQTTKPEKSAKSSRKSSSKIHRENVRDSQPL